MAATEWPLVGPSGVAQGAALSVVGQGSSIHIKDGRIEILASLPRWSVREMLMPDTHSKIKILCIFFLRSLSLLRYRTEAQCFCDVTDGYCNNRKKIVPDVRIKASKISIKYPLNVVFIPCHILWCGMYM
jgi:hypothetical protein